MPRSDSPPDRAPCPACPWWAVLLRALLAQALALFMLVGPETKLAGFVWALGLYWLVDGALVMALWAAGPLRSGAGPVLRGLLLVMGGFAVVSNPSLGLLTAEAVVLTTGIVVILAGTMEASRVLRHRRGPDGPGAFGVAGALQILTGAGFLAAPRLTALNFSVFIGGVALVGSIALILYAARIAFGGGD